MINLPKFTNDNGYFNILIQTLNQHFLKSIPQYIQILRIFQLIFMIR